MNRSIKTIIPLLCCVFLLSCGGKTGKSKTKKEKFEVKGKLVQETESKSTSTVSSHQEPSNHPPQLIDLSFSPALPMTGDRIKAVVNVFDPDGDNITLRYSWSINGEPVQESEDPVLRHTVREGDRIDLTVTASDEESKSQPISGMVFVGNSPPDAQVEQQRLVGDLYVAHIHGSDPEGNKLTFALKEAPPGMKIDKNTGLIKWKIEKGVQGEFPVEVSVKDAKGAETLVSYTVKISRRKNETKKKQP